MSLFSWTLHPGAGRQIKTKMTTSMAGGDNEEILRSEIKQVRAKSDDEGWHFTKGS